LIQLYPPLSRARGRAHPRGLSAPRLWGDPMVRAPPRATPAALFSWTAPRPKLNTDDEFDFSLSPHMSRVKLAACNTPNRGARQI